MGPKVYALYVGLIVYNILILYYCLRYWKILDKEKREAIFSAVPVFVIVTIINITVPEALFTVVCVTIILMGLILSNENNEKYIDKQSGMFNQYAFETVLSEYIKRRTSFCVSVISLGESEDSIGRLDWRMHLACMKNIQRYLKRSYRKSAYRIGENGCAVFSGMKREAESIGQGIQEYVSSRYPEEGFVVNRTVLSDHPGNDESYAILSEIYGFCSEMNNKMAYFDFLTGVRNRNSFEREWNRLHKNGENAYYLTADLNDLKLTNDSMGHSAGDELLQAFAKLLTEVTSDMGMVFRQGGDEFAVLFSGEDVNAFLDELENRRKTVNKSRGIPISFAIGYCPVLEDDSFKKADEMMYAMKKEMKKHG